jgi:hypothetical protein
MGESFSCFFRLEFCFKIKYNLESLKFSTKVFKNYYYKILRGIPIEQNEFNYFEECKSLLTERNKTLKMVYFELSLIFKLNQSISRNDIFETTSDDCNHYETSLLVQLLIKNSNLKSHKILNHI